METDRGMCSHFRILLCTHGGSLQNQTQGTHHGGSIKYICYIMPLIAEDVTWFTALYLQEALAVPKLQQNMYCPKHGVTFWKTIICIVTVMWISRIYIVIIRTCQGDAKGLGLDQIYVRVRRDERHKTSMKIHGNTVIFCTESFRTKTWFGMFYWALNFPLILEIQKHNFHYSYSI